MSSALTPAGFPSGGDSSGFVQNGQVDWAKFGEHVWRVSSVTLQRFASAGVQPITFGAGLALGNLFELDHIGNERMHNALTNLRSVPGLNQVLWFGFGVQSFMRVMSEQQLGINCIALCSVLCEGYSNDVAAWILEDIWKVNSYPQPYLPSHSQFVALTRACSGVLAKTSFGQTVDRMLDDVYVNTKPSMVADPGMIAKTLQSIFKISRKKIARISVFGGAECAFVAALAYWLFNLKVYIEDESRTVIYQDTIPEEAQVFVAYRGPDDLSLIQVSSTTHILGDVDDLWYRNPSSKSIDLVIRTPWDGCLARMFGTTFINLANLPHILGGFLGSTARIYRALALGEATTIKFSRQSFINFAEASYGPGFIDSAMSSFAELSRLVGLMAAMRVAEEVLLNEVLRAAEQTLLNLS